MTKQKKPQKERRRAFFGLFAPLKQIKGARTAGKAEAEASNGRSGHDCRLAKGAGKAERKKGRPDGRAEAERPEGPCLAEARSDPNYQKGQKGPEEREVFLEGQKRTVVKKIPVWVGREKNPHGGNSGSGSVCGWLKLWVLTLEVVNFVVSNFGLVFSPYLHAKRWLCLFSVQLKVV